MAPAAGTVTAESEFLTLPLPFTKDQVSWVFFCLFVFVGFFPQSFSGVCERQEQGLLGLPPQKT